MVAEVVETMRDIPAGVVLDATVGSGGHAEAILASRSEISVLGFDRDEDAIARSSQNLAAAGERAELCQLRSDRLSEELDRRGIASISGFLMDLGVSSEQIDSKARGFSFRSDGRLDMRMDKTSPLTAGDVVNGYEEERLASLLASYGDERFSRRVAKAIVANRPIHDTRRLAEAIEKAIPSRSRRSSGHPARRSFQAIRIEVNEELRILQDTLPQAVEALKPDGRGVLISYHSGEDRIVKDFLRQAETGGCECPAKLPCQCGAVPQLKLLHRGARKPTEQEVQANPRSSSARMRSFVKLAADEQLPEAQQRKTHLLETQQGEGAT